METETNAWPDWFDGLGAALRGVGPGMQGQTYESESLWPHPLDPPGPIAVLEIPMSPAGWDYDDE